MMVASLEPVVKVGKLKAGIRCRLLGGCVDRDTLPNSGGARHVGVIFSPRDATSDKIQSYAASTKESAVSSDDTVIGWVRGLEERNPEAAQRLWERYFTQMVRLAGQKLPRHGRRAFDEEDVALSAFKSFCAGVEQGRFPRLSDQDNLWRLLVVITARKADAYKRHELRQKRGAGKVVGESDLRPARPEDDEVGFDVLISGSPTPAFALEVAEELRSLLHRLGDEELRKIALLKMEGYTVDEISGRTGLARRAVERRLQQIRQAWSKADRPGPRSDDRRAMPD
jgi:DNA-directed RNA polymerase specialized sigma24 family protein